MSSYLKQGLKNIRMSVLDIVHKKDIVSMSYEDAINNVLAVYKPKPFYTRELKLQPLEKNNYNVSFIIPAYNCGSYIGKCLDTLLNQQTEYTYEIIIVNDGSKDNTEFVISQINSPLIRLINQSNGGAAMARNTGLCAATGEYVCFVDGDDYVEPDYIQTLLSAAYENNSDIAKCGYYQFKEGEPDKLFVKESKVINEGFESHIMEYDGFIWNMVEKRSLWKDIQFPEKWWFEDMITKLLVMRKAKRFSYIGKPLYHYGIFESSLSRSEWKSMDFRAIDQLWLVKEIVENIDKFGLSNDSSQYPLILWELGTMLYGRTVGLDNTIRKSLFLISCYLTDMYRKNRWNNQLSKIKLRKLDKAFQDRDFALWEFVSSKG